jgi:SHS2 domain-containing protein
MKRPQHVFEEHVGEIQIRIEAEGLAELFAEAGRALAELQSDASRIDAPREIENVTVRAPDREALLAEWLNELIFRSETRHCAFPDLEVTRISDRELQARIGGVAIVQPRVAVKAATLHGLRVEEQRGGFTATVVLDV